MYATYTVNDCERVYHPVMQQMVADTLKQLGSRRSIPHSSVMYTVGCNPLQMGS